MGGTNKCPLCDATFTRPQHVARHMRAHTGDRPYPCLFCPERFARSDLLSRHRNKFHPHGADSEPPPPKYTRTKPVKPRVSKLDQSQGEVEKKEKKSKLPTKKEKIALAAKEQGQDFEQADGLEIENPCPVHNLSDSPPFLSTSYSYPQPIPPQPNLDGCQTQSYDASSASSTALSSSSLYPYPVQTSHHHPYNDLIEEHALSRSSLSSGSGSSNSDVGNSMLYQQQQQRYQQQYQQQQQQQHYQRQMHSSMSRPQTHESLSIERRLSLPEPGVGGYHGYQLSDTYPTHYGQSQQLASSYELSFLGSTYPLMSFTESISSSPSEEAQMMSAQEPISQYSSLPGQIFSQPQLPHQLQQQQLLQQQQQPTTQTQSSSQSTLFSQPSVLTNGSPMSSTSSGSSLDTTSSNKSTALPSAGTNSSLANQSNFGLFDRESGDYSAYNNSSNDDNVRRSSLGAYYLPHLEQYNLVGNETQSQIGHWSGKDGTDVPLMGWRANDVAKDLQDGFVSAFPALSLSADDSGETDVNVTEKVLTSSPDPIPRPPQLNPLQQPAVPRRRAPTGVVSPPTAYNGGFLGSGHGHNNSSFGNSQGIKIPSLDDVKDIWKMFMQDGCGGLTPSYGIGGSFNNSQSGGVGSGLSTGSGLTPAQQHIPIPINQTTHPLRLSTMPVTSGGATVVEPPSISSSLMLPTLTSTETPPLTNAFLNTQQQPPLAQQQSHQPSSESFSTAIKSLPPLRLNMTNARKNSNKGMLDPFAGLNTSLGGREGERDGSSAEVTSLSDGLTGKQSAGTTMTMNNSHARMNPFGGMKREPSQELIRSGCVSSFGGIGHGSSSGSGFGLEGLDDWVDPRKKMRRMRSGSVGRIPEHEVWDGFWDSLRPLAPPSTGLPTHGLNPAGGFLNTSSVRGREDLGRVG